MRGPRIALLIEVFRWPRYPRLDLDHLVHDGSGAEPKAKCKPHITNDDFRIEPFEAFLTFVALRRICHPNISSCPGATCTRSAGW